MFLCIVTFLVLNLSGTASASRHLRVLGGRDVSEGEYPFAVVLISRKNGHGKYHRFCSASVISKKWVLTAGHCVKRVEAKDMRVWPSNFTIPPEKSTSLIKVHGIFRHPGFVSKKYGHLALYNDICLLRVAALTVAWYGRILAVDHLTMIGLPVTYVGGGRTVKDKQNSTRPLQMGTAVISSCGKEKTYNMHIICIFPKCAKKKQQAYNGDSGGPLMFQDRIIGVCSYGRKSRFIPKSIFAPVSPYIDWIYNVMHSMNKTHKDTEMTNK